MSTTKHALLCAAASAFILIAAPAYSQDGKSISAARPPLELPQTANTPDGLGIAPNGDLILSVPNFNNDHLAEFGLPNAPAPAFMG